MTDKGAETVRTQEEAARQGLYLPQMEHDACGIGAVVSIEGFKTRSTVDQALKIVEKLEHRAGKDADGSTGDGVGIMTQIPHAFFSRLELGFDLPGERNYGVGMLFLPADHLKRAQARKLMEIVTQKEGLRFLGWRTVPVCPEVLGERARACMPVIEQCFIARPDRLKQGVDFDRRLYVVRRAFEQSNADTYVCSLSSRTVVYKGMFLVSQLRAFYPDLQSEDFTSAIAMVHSRFSTNTFPSWERAHPNRLILHNGEINTIRGNVDRMIAREETLSSPLMESDMDKVLPVINDHPGAVAERAGYFPHPAGSVPLLRHYDGALGRPCFHPVLRRRRDGRGAGPQRTAAIPLLYYG